MKALIREKLISEIKLAFKGVKLGNGVGLYEAMGIDDYLPRSEQLQLRLKDEKYRLRIIKKLIKTRMKC